MRFIHRLSGPSICMWRTFLLLKTGIGLSSPEEELVNPSCEPSEAEQTSYTFDNIMGNSQACSFLTMFVFRYLILKSQKYVPGNLKSNQNLCYQWGLGLRYLDITFQWSIIIIWCIAGFISNHFYIKPCEYDQVYLSFKSEFFQLLIFQTAYLPYSINSCLIFNGLSTIVFSLLMLLGGNCICKLVCRIYKYFGSVNSDSNFIHYTICKYRKIAKWNSEKCTSLSWQVI